MEYKGFTIECDVLTEIRYGNEVFHTNEKNYHIIGDGAYYCAKKPIKSVRQAKSIITRIINKTYYEWQRGKANG